MRQNKLQVNSGFCVKKRMDNTNSFDIKVDAVMSNAWYEYMDIVLADFGEIKDDCLIHKSRPAIIVSRTEYNRNSPVMQVLPMSKKFKNLDSHYHVFVDCKDCENLNASGVAMIEQMTTIDRAHIVHYIGRIVDTRLVEKIQRSIAEQLGLEV